MLASFAFLAGLAALVAGFILISVPAGLIVFGTATCATAVAYHRGSRPAPEQAER